MAVYPKGGAYGREESFAFHFSRTIHLTARCVCVVQSAFIAVINLPLGRPLTTSRVAATRKEMARIPTKKFGLTNREREVTQLLAEGHRSKSIARALGISVKTVETHRYNIMRTINCQNMADLVRYAIRNHMIEA
jgi:DNA-binding CsgD family transcriptional regulator